jgi:hypothetical protein
MKLVIAVFVCEILLAACASAQSKPRPPRGRMGPPLPAAVMIERLNRMTPEQRQRALDRLPPDRRERVERRLENFNSLPPVVKERLREQYDQFQQLSPERQNAMRRAFRQLNEFPDDRKPVVRRELIRLRRMNPEERTAAIDSEEFRERFNGAERQVLSDLSNSILRNEAP